jgi:hypothetical protein
MVMMKSPEILTARFRDPQDESKTPSIERRPDRSRFLQGVCASHPIGREKANCGPEYCEAAHSLQTQQLGGYLQ